VISEEWESKDVLTKQWKRYERAQLRPALRFFTFTPKH
jgi:hypothetical protein